MVDRPTPDSNMETPPSQYLLDRPLPLTELSSLNLSADELTAIRKVRLAWICELHRKELKRLGSQVRQAQRRALLKKDDQRKTAQLAEVQQLRKSVLSLAKQYKQQEAEACTWVPRCSIPDDHGGVTFDPVTFDLLGSNLEGYLQHIPSFFSVEWAGNGSLTETLPRFAHRPVAKEKKALDQRVLVRQQILNDAVFKEWISEVYETFCDWFPPTNSGRPTTRPSLFPGQLTRRVKPKLYTLQVVNHYIPGLNLTEGYLDELLKPIIKGEPKPGSVQTAPDDLLDEPSTTLGPLHALAKIEERLRQKKHVRVARGKS